MLLGGNLRHRPWLVIFWDFYTGYRASEVGRLAALRWAIGSAQWLKRRR